MQSVTYFCIAFLIQIALNAPGWACTGPPSTATIPEKTRVADVAILGKAVTNLGSVQGGRSSSSKIIEVGKWLKGAGPRHVTIHGFGSSASCMVDVPLHTDFVFFGKLDRATGDVHLSYTGLYDAVEKADVAGRVSVVVGSPPSDPKPATPIRERH